MRRILVVDDEPHVSRVTKLHLERGGYTVVTARDGLEALERLRADEFDAIVTDIMMPRLSGRELCLVVRETMPQLDIPILVLTSSSEDEHRDWAQELPRTELLEKPVSLRKLQALLEELLDAKAGTSA